MNLLLDTHAVLWTLADDPRLGKKANKLVKQAKEGALAISDVSLLEIALLAHRGRLSIEGSLRSLLDEACAAFRVLPIDPAIAVKAMEFNMDQADPFDRIIAATAWHHRMALLTRDARLTRCPEIETIW